MRKIRTHLSYANVVATLALVVAVAGGSAVAAGKIGPKQLKKNAVTPPKIAANAITTKKIKAGAVSGDKLAADAVGKRFPTIQVVQQTASLGSGGVSCPAGTRLIAGGANAIGGELVASRPDGNNWSSAATAGTTSLTTYAVCIATG